MEPWCYSPQGMICNRPPLMFTYGQSVPLGMPVGPHSNFLLPPLPSPIPAPTIDIISSVVSAWEAEFGPTLKQRREELDTKRRISVFDFKKKLARWKELLENSGSPSTKKELEWLEQECTDPELLQIMKRKLERSRRRRRIRKDIPIVLPTGVGEVLSRLPATDVSDLSPQPPPSTPLKATEDTDTLLPTKHLAGLKNASAFCQEKLRILNKLKQLREARVDQLRNQGKLIPEQLDQAFEEKRHSIQLEIESMLKGINELTIRLGSANQTSLQESDKPLVSIDDTVTPSGLPQDVHHLIFGPRNADTGARWNKFFCQANLNFSDFLRIRSRWDEYLVPSDSVEIQDVPDCGRHPPSLLPTVWQLPPS